MKRFAAWLLLLAMGLCAAAEDLGSLPAYLDAANLAAIGVDEWSGEAGGRLLSASPSPDAQVSLCARDGRLLAVSVTAPKGDTCEELALRVLAPGGWLDEARLRSLLAAGGETDENGICLMRLEGDVREGVYLCAGGGPGELLWQPTHGGEDRHQSPLCSGMDVPRLITAEIADALGLPPCSKCMGGQGRE